MKKRLLVVTSALCISLLTLAGCANGDQSSKKSSDNTEKTDAVYYQNLGKADKKNVKFEFQISQDETKDNAADPVYMVSMKVKNNSSKTIKFHKDKFVYALPENKIVSSGEGTLTVQPGKTKSIDQLFDDVPEQGTLGDGVIEYLNGNNKLAYAKFENNVATSDNLKDKNLSKNNESTTGDSSTHSNASSDTSSTATTSQSSSSTATTSSSSAGISEAKAAQILQSSGDDFGGYSFSDLTPVQGDNGSWGFQNPLGLVWNVSSSGSISAPGD